MNETRIHDIVVKSTFNGSKLESAGMCKLLSQTPLLVTALYSLCHSSPTQPLVTTDPTTKSWFCRSGREVLHKSAGCGKHPECPAGTEGGRKREAFSHQQSGLSVDSD